jgi:hypothetical protein
MSRQSFRTPTDSGFTIRRRAPNDTAARTPAIEMTLLMDDVVMSDSKRLEGAEPEFSVGRA